MNSFRFIYIPEVINVYVFLRTGEFQLITIGSVDYFPSCFGQANFNLAEEPMSSKLNAADIVRDNANRKRNEVYNRYELLLQYRLEQVSAEILQQRAGEILDIDRWEQLELVKIKNS